MRADRHTDFRHASLDACVVHIGLSFSCESHNDGLHELVDVRVFDRVRRFDAIHHRHGNVHQDETVPATALSLTRGQSSLDRLVPVVGLRELASPYCVTFEMEASEGVLQDQQIHFVVVHDKHFMASAWLRVRVQQLLLLL